jgi:hypothetical protein
MMNVSREGTRDGSAECGGINRHMFVKDGETSYSRRRLHPNWISTSQLVISTSAKKMKKEGLLLALK